LETGKKGVLWNRKKSVGIRLWGKRNQVGGRKGSAVADVLRAEESRAWGDF